MYEHARHFPVEAYTSMPWRNGAGVTREIARELAQGENFGVATEPRIPCKLTDPFSSYAGGTSGASLSLRAAGFACTWRARALKRSQRAAHHVLFAGAAAAKLRTSRRAVYGS